MRFKFDYKYDWSINNSNDYDDSESGIILITNIILC